MRSAEASPPESSWCAPNERSIASTSFRALATRARRADAPPSTSKRTDGALPPLDNGAVVEVVGDAALAGPLPPPMGCLRADGRRVELRGSGGYCRRRRLCSRYSDRTRGSRRRHLVGRIHCLRTQALQLRHISRRAANQQAGAAKAAATADSIH